MDISFLEKYGIYDGVKSKSLKHLPEISCYNNNFYIGLKRDNSTTNDLIFVKSDDDNMSMYYIVNGDTSTYIGYSFIDEGDIIILSDRPFI